MIRKAKAVWRGTGRAGSGHLSSDSGVLAEADVEHARHHRVDTVLSMLVRHQFCATGHLHPDHIRTGF